MTAINESRIEKHLLIVKLGGVHSDYCERLSCVSLLQASQSR